MHTEVKEFAVATAFEGLWVVSSQTEWGKKCMLGLYDSSLDLQGTKWILFFRSKLVFLYVDN